MTKYREIDMDFTIFGSSPKYKIGSLFVNFSTLKSVIFQIFIYMYVLFENIASVLSFQNLGIGQLSQLKYWCWFDKN